ncbi:MAG: TlpA family protein disulfide reductase [Anaerolineales bacterium]|nr:TlpA family protein disulfide reductase [Anaerolineales bacterium]
MKHHSSKRWTAFTIIVLVFFAGWIWISKGPASSNLDAEVSLPHQGFSAPDFSLETIHGETVTLSELQGRPVIINLWASWCPPCRAEMPALQNVYEDYQDQGLVVLAVNATDQDNLDEAIEFAQEHWLTFPVLLDVTGMVSRMYKLQSLPTTFFVDDTGVIQEIVIGGPMAEALLRVRVEQLLEGAPR